MDDPPKHNLATWERCQLNKYGKETEVLQAELQYLDVYWDHERKFGACYFGGVEARAKWGWMLWEYNVYGCLDSDGSLRALPQSIKEDLAKGVDTFWARFCAPRGKRALPNTQMGRRICSVTVSPPPGRNGKPAKA